MRRSARTAGLGLAAVLGLGAPARADLDADVTRIQSAWKARGEVLRLTPRLLERGELRPLFIPASALDPSDEGCTTVVVLGTLDTSFVLRFLPPRGVPFWPEGEHPELSIAGAAQLVRCGARKAMLERLAVEVRSPRAVVEVLVARGSRPFPPLLRTLTERDPGPLAPLGVSGPRPISAPLTERLRSLEARSRSKGASALERRWFRAAPNGTGEIELKLAEGCHRLDVLGAPPEEPGASVDIDADLIAGVELLASDRSDSSDATLELCLGKATALRLRFAGALPGLPVVLAASRWSLPSGLPESWAPEQRAHLAEALRQHRGASPSGTPVYTSLGVSGVTLLPIELEPSRCYLAAVSAIRGEPSGIAMSAELGAFQAQNRSAPGKAGTTLAFCARGQDSVLVDVEARGAGVGWLFALWPTGQLPLGELAE